MDVILNTRFQNPNLPMIPVPGFFDDFNRTDAATLGRTSADNKEWKRLDTSVAARGKIVNGKAVNTAGTQYEVVDSFAANGKLTATLSTLDTRVAGLMFRALSPTNYLRLATRLADGDPQYSLSKIVNGTRTIIQTLATTSADGDVVEITLNGTAVLIKINGNTAMASTAVPELATATQHGIWWGLGSNFAVDSIGFVPA